jgi:hypothetical protein
MSVTRSPKTRSSAERITTFLLVLFPQTLDRLKGKLVFWLSLQQKIMRYTSKIANLNRVMRLLRLPYFDYFSLFYLLIQEGLRPNARNFGRSVASSNLL